MFVLFYMGHPAHFHLFKYVIQDLKLKNHQIQIVIKSKDILETLLLNEDQKYVNLLPEGRGNTKADILFALLKRDIRLAKMLYLKDKRNKFEFFKKVRPDVFEKIT